MGEPRRMSYGFDGSEDEDDPDDDDPALDQPVESVGPLDERGRIGFHLRGHVGDFCASRLLRFRVPLASICGARLLADGLPDGRALLVLELAAPPEEAEVGEGGGEGAEPAEEETEGEARGGKRGEGNGMYVKGRER